MLKRRLGQIGLLTLVLLGLAGCGQAPQNPPPATQEPAPAQQAVQRTAQQSTQPAATPPSAVPTPSRPAADYAAVIFAERPGIHRVTGADLQQQGVPIESIDPAQMALISYRTPLPIYIEAAQPGKFGPGDSIYFYAEGPTAAATYFNDRMDYFPRMQRCELFFAGKPADRLRYDARETSAPAHADPAYPALVVAGKRHEEINLYFEFIHRDEYASQSMLTDFIFWQKLTYPETNKTSSSLKMPIILDATQARHAVKLRVQLAGTANFGSNAVRDEHHVRIDWNGQLLSDHHWKGRPIDKVELDLPPGQCVEGTNTLAITVLEPIVAAPTNRMKLDVVYLDWYELGYRQNAATRPKQNQLLLEDASASGGLRKLRIGNFPSDQAMVFDLNARELVKSPSWADATSSGTWAVNVTTSNTTRTLAVLGREQAFTSPYTTATLRTHYFEEQTSGTDFLILTNRNFEAALQPFVEWKRQRGLHPKVVCTQDLYNERNGGYQLPETLRDYIKHVYENTSPPTLKYVLLVGDATAISMYHTSLPSYSYVLTGHAANENYFANFTDPGGTAQVAMGRFSVSKPEEVTHIANKVMAYEQRMHDGLWRARFCMIAASYDWAKSQSDKLLHEHVHPNYLAQYLWSDPKNSNPAYHEQINQQLQGYLNAGNLMTVFLGHGGGTIWEIGPTLFQGAMTKHLFDQSNVTRLTNVNMPSLIFALTCYTNDFDNPDVGETLGETFLNSAGGAIGVIGAAQRTSTYSNQAFIEKFFTLARNRIGARLGDYFLETKRQLPGADYQSVYLLLGDPTLEFNLPQPQITLQYPKLEAGQLQADYTLPKAVALPAELQYALVDDQDNELAVWHEKVTTAQGKIAKMLPDGVSAAKVTRLVVYCSSGAAGDFTGAAVPQQPAPVATAAAATSATTTTTQGK